MLISVNWLKELIDIDCTPQELAERLTRAGNAVEGIEKIGDDYVLDLDLTSNRADCLSHLGIAREISAITGKTICLATPESSLPSTTSKAPVTLDAADLCKRFTARIIRGVKVGPSPEWLVKRLEAVGERSINNIADVTNYVMHELGQPMHSFDLDKLAENRIVVRRAKDGEKITTLDEVERNLDASMLAICDAEKPVAVAGVMGGFDSGISDATSNVLLEVAYFDRASIRRTSRTLKLNSEASQRFERGVDIENLIRASDRATQLILELAGGTAEVLVDVFPAPIETKQVACADISSAVKRLTGLEIGKPEATAILARLGIVTTDGKTFTAPTWRHDIAIAEDLVEEVARIVGYDKIAEELPPAFGAGEYQPGESRKSRGRRALADLGFCEAISYSFIDSSSDGRFETVPGLVDGSLPEPHVTLKDSVIEGAVRMRPTLLPGLLEAVRTNFNQQEKNVRLFEIGKAFAASKNDGGLPAERELATLVVSGSETFEGKALGVRAIDFFDAKGAVEAFAEAIGTNVTFKVGSVRHLRTGQSAEIQSNGKTIGYIGRLRDSVAERYKFKQPVFVAELDLDALLAGTRAVSAYTPLPVYPGVARDISLIVARSVEFENIRSLILGAGHDLLDEVRFVDVFEGKGIAEGERSLTIRLEYRSADRTLTDEEVDGVHAKIVSMIETETSARLRA